MKYNFIIYCLNFVKTIDKKKKKTFKLSPLNIFAIGYNLLIVHIYFEVNSYIV